MGDDDNNQNSVEMEEQQRGRAADIKTYTEPLDLTSDPRIKQFLMNFYKNVMFKKQEEMKQLLEQYPDTLGKYHKDLVPSQMTNEDFWQRYYYRVVEDVGSSAGQEEEKSGGISKNDYHKRAGTPRGATESTMELLSLAHTHTEQHKAEIEGVDEGDEEEEIDPAMDVSDALVESKKEDFLQKQRMATLDDSDEEDDDQDEYGATRQRRTSGLLVEMDDPPSPMANSSRRGVTNESTMELLKQAQARSKDTNQRQNGLLESQEEEEEEEETERASDGDIPMLDDSQNEEDSDDDYDEERSKRLEQERMEAIEAEKAAALAKERLEKERIAAEEAEKAAALKKQKLEQEQERLRKEQLEKERIKRERLAAEEAKKRVAEAERIAAEEAKKRAAEAERLEKAEATAAMGDYENSSPKGMPKEELTDINLSPPGSPQAKHHHHHGAQETTAGVEGVEWEDEEEEKKEEKRQQQQLDAEERERRALELSQRKVKDRWAAEKAALKKEQEETSHMTPMPNPFEEAMTWTGQLVSAFVQDILDPIPEEPERPEIDTARKSIRDLGAPAFAMEMDGGNLASCLEGFSKHKQPSTFRLELPTRLTDEVSGRIHQVAAILRKSTDIRTVVVVVPTYLDEEVSLHSDMMELFEALGSLPGLEGLNIESSSEKHRANFPTKLLGAILQGILLRHDDNCEELRGLNSLIMKDLALVDTSEDMADYAEAMSTLKKILTLRSAHVEMDCTVV